MPGMPMSSEHHGRMVARRRHVERIRAAVGDVHVGAQQAQQHREAVGGVAVVVDDQDARDAARRGRSCGAAGPILAGASPAAIGRRTMNSLPLPETVAARLDAAAVHLDETLHQREPDAQAALRAPGRCDRPA